MGTEIQCKTHFQGSSSLKGLNDNAGSGSGVKARRHEEGTLKKDQNYGLFAMRQAMDGCLGYHKEQVRQTILDQESIFRHQLQELHRLYKRQRDLMNEIERRELPKHPTAAETSQLTPLLSHFTSENAKKTWQLPHVRPVGSTATKPFTSGTYSGRDRALAKNCGTVESKCSMFQHRMFNFELPAEIYTNNNGKQIQERVFGVRAVESYPFNWISEAIHIRDVNFSAGGGLSHGCTSEASKNNLYTGSAHGMADPNKPIRVKETSASASVGNLRNTTCPEREIQRGDTLNSNSCFHFLSQKSSHSCLVGRNGRIFQSERNMKERLTCNAETGNTRCDKNYSQRFVGPKDSSGPPNPLKIDPRKTSEPSTSLLLNKSNTENLRKRKIFGVEISEGNPDQCLVASHMSSLHPVITQSDVANSEAWTLSPCIILSNDLNWNPISVKGNTCMGSADPSKMSSNMLMQSPGFVRGEMHTNGSLMSSSSSGGEVSHQNGLYFASMSYTGPPQVCCSSIGYNFPNGVNGNISGCRQSASHGHIKCFTCSKCAPNYKCDEQEMPQQIHQSLDRQRKHKNPEGEPSFKGNAISIRKSTNGREDCHQMNFYSSKNYRWQFADQNETEKYTSPTFLLNSTPLGVPDAELRRNEVSECPCYGKFSGSPVLDVLHASKDVTILSHPSQSSTIASEVAGDETWKGLAHAPKSGDQVKAKDLVIEKGQGNYILGLRHNIDLNLSLDEEEAQSVPSLPNAIVKIATTALDLEAPAVLESEKDLSLEGGPPEEQFQKPCELSMDESMEHNDEYVRIAAETIVIISSSGFIMDDTTCHSSEASSDSLYWFAEAISSCKNDFEGKVEEVTLDANSACHEESIPDGMDYFEFMTLRLSESKLDDYRYKHLASESRKDEETGLILMPKRPRKGQARRGRQRKDFQRDILPGLISLSRHEVTEDLQSIEQLVRADRRTQPSSPSPRNITKGRKGKRHLGGSTPPRAATTVCHPLIQQHSHRGLGLDERCLTGWGRRTRRFPRQRCTTDNSNLSPKI